MRFELVPKSLILDDIERAKRHSCRNKIGDRRDFVSHSVSKFSILMEANVYNKAMLWQRNCTMLL